jgi:uncharacterized protein with ParB-like and HNH nuclease domain
MQANPRNLIGLFEHTLRYVVPIFQRHYVWREEDHWIPLWEDILEKFTQRRSNHKTAPHFLGAVILDAAKKRSTRETSRFLVIDGQQRITTIQLLLTALRDFASSRGFGNLSNAINRTLFNPDPELMENRSEEIYKVWPTQFNRKIFCGILNAGSYEAVSKAYPIIKLPRRRKPEPRDRLVEAYVFFYSKVDELCADLSEDDSEEDALLELYGVLKDDFAVVEIILGEQDDSQEIFNSLNSHGEPLSQSDLLRSFIFMRAEKSSEDRDKLYEMYWRQFEDTFWDMATRRGSLLASRLDLITRIFLSSKIGMAVDAKKVHLKYKDWIQTSKPFETVEAELKAFAAYGGRFRYLIEPPGNDRFSEFARRLQVWDVTTAFPLVIYLFEEANLDENEILECFRILESYLVRRLICKKDNKEYNKYFIEVVNRLRNDGASQATLKKILATGSGTTREWPNDSEFEHHWLTSPMYNVLQSAQIVTILKMLEYKIRTPKTENVPIPTASVEHIMPQEWAEHYRLDGTLVPKAMSKDWFYSSNQEEMSKWQQIKEKVQARNRAIHCFGNLTIVTQPLNSAMKNAPFKTKKAELRKSLLLLNRYFDSLKIWDEAKMDRRARNLLRTAKTIWFGPNEA